MGDFPPKSLTFCRENLTVKMQQEAAGEQKARRMESKFEKVIGLAIDRRYLEIWFLLEDERDG